MYLFHKNFFLLAGLYIKIADDSLPGIMGCLLQKPQRTQHPCQLCLEGDHPNEYHTLQIHPAVLNVVEVKP